LPGSGNSTAGRELDGGCEPLRCLFSAELGSDDWNELGCFVGVPNVVL